MTPDRCANPDWTVPEPRPTGTETFADVMASVPDLRAGDRAYHAAQTENLRRLAARKDAS